MNLRDVPAIVAFRLLPFLAYVAFARSLSLRPRFVIVASFLACVALVFVLGGDLSEILVRGPLALAYFAVVSLAVYELKPRVQSGKLRRLALLAFLALLFVALPELALRSPVLLVTIVVGWESMLSAYSYCVDGEHGAERASRGGCLFFILVNPCLVYADRGRRVAESAFPWRSIGRVLSGALVWVGQCGIQAALVVGLSDSSPGSQAKLLALCFGGGVVLYFAHSGLASIQIGFMRVLGHEVPERYRYPFLSRSPQEFWRRWNVYLGSWIRRYAFIPTARAMSKRGRAAAASISTLASFLLVGALHDYLTSVGRFGRHAEPAVTANATLLFGVYGAALLSWHGASSVLRRAMKHRPLASLPTWVSSGVSWAAFLPFQCAMFWLFSQANVAF